MELAKGFYKTAKSDFRVAKILYDNEEFANTIYHLQQGIEKLSKSFGLFNQIIKPDDIKDISHNSKKVFTKHFHAQQKEFDKMEDVEKIFPDLFRFKRKDEEVNLTAYNEKIQKALNIFIHLKPDDFLWISDEDLDLIKNLISKIDTEVEINFDDTRYNFPELFKSIISQIEEKTGTKIEEANIENKEFLSAIEDVRKVITSGLKMEKIYLTLFFFSLITSGHNQRTRYPCICCGELPENNYDKDEIIVKRYNEIHKIMEDTITLFEEIFIEKRETSLQQSISTK